jgi:NTP pyrophosphatase (non-canonical NTP hydrolase)
MKDEDEELKDLTIHALKELGEIAETLIKKDRLGHWKNELGDLCGLCIKPMLELAEIDFDTACQVGINRRQQKMHEKHIKNAGASAP